MWADSSNKKMKPALLNIFILTMELMPNSAVSLSSGESFSIF